MSLLQIPTFVDDASSTQLISLEDVIYTLRIFWNVRDEAWYLDIYLADNTPVLCGIKMVVNFTLLSQFEIDGLPPGDFILFDESGNNEMCGRDELGNRCALIYITSDDEILNE